MGCAAAGTCVDHQCLLGHQPYPSMRETYGYWTLGWVGPSTRTPTIFIDIVDVSVVLSNVKDYWDFQWRCVEFQAAKASSCLNVTCHGASDGPTFNSREIGVHWLDLRFEDYFEDGWDGVLQTDGVFNFICRSHQLIVSNPECELN